MYLAKDLIFWFLEAC